MFYFIDLIVLLNLNNTYFYQTCAEISPKMLPPPLKNVQDPRLDLYRIIRIYTDIRVLTADPLIMFLFLLFTQTVSVTVSVMTLTSISIDRWYAICHPLKFKSTTGRARTAIIIIWIVGLASGNKILKLCDEPKTCLGCMTRKNGGGAADV